ncbi:hypothetical protein [Nannocystis pusilla]|uniref:hypothetical protein n=1 Tax=Nannocystis pusilla TaxID=889268 RepID=UPI003B762F7E
MMVVFMVSLKPGSDPGTLLTAEMKSDTGALVMTLDDAPGVGFSGLPPGPEGVEVRVIAVRGSDADWVQRRLESHEAVSAFQKHDFE